MKQELSVGAIVAIVALVVAIVGGVFAYFTYRPGLSSDQQKTFQAAIQARQEEARAGQHGK